MKKSKRAPLIVLLVLLGVFLLGFYVVDTYNIILIKPIWVSTAYDDVGSRWYCPSQGIEGTVYPRENGETCTYMQLSGEGIDGNCRILFLDFQTVELTIDGETVGCALARYRKRFGKVNKFIISDFRFRKEYSYYSDVLAKQYVFFRKT